MALFDKDGKKAKTLMFYKNQDADLLEFLVNNPDLLDFNSFCKKHLRQAMEQAKQAQTEPVTLTAIEKIFDRTLKKHLSSITVATVNQALPTIEDDMEDDSEEDFDKMFV